LDFKYLLRFWIFNKNKLRLSYTRLRRSG